MNPERLEGDLVQSACLLGLVLRPGSSCSAPGNKRAADALPCAHALWHTERHSTKGLPEGHPKGQQSWEAAVLLWRFGSGGLSRAPVLSASCHMLSSTAFSEPFSQDLITQGQTHPPLYCLPAQTTTSSTVTRKGPTKHSTHHSHKLSTFQTEAERL